MTIFNDEFEYFFNKYITYYNKNDPIRALVDFESIVSGLKNRKKTKLKVLKDKIYEMVIGTFKICDIDIMNHVSKPIKFKNKVNELHSFACKVYITDSPNFGPTKTDEDRLNKILIEIYGLIDSCENDIVRYNFELDNSTLKWIKKDYKLQIKMGWNISALTITMIKIKDGGYPERLKLLGEMTNEEQEKIHNETISSFDLQKDDYWKTAYDIYDNDESKIWKDVWIELEKLREKNYLHPKYSSFSSFKRNKSKHDKKRMNE